jgi:hypothetical protein
MPTPLQHTAERVPLEQIPESELLAKHAKFLARPNRLRSAGWTPRSKQVVSAPRFRLNLPKSRLPKPAPVPRVLTIAATVHGDRLVTDAKQAGSSSRRASLGSQIEGIALKFRQTAVRKHKARTLAAAERLQNGHSWKLMITSRTMQVFCIVLFRVLLRLCIRIGTRFEVFGVGGIQNASVVRELSQIQVSAEIHFQKNGPMVRERNVP